jgi:hypothetical protein
VQRPGQEFGDRRGHFVGGQDAVEFPPSKDGSALGEEMVGHPGDSVGGKKPAQGAAADGIGGQFDASRGVDNDGRHASSRARSSAKVSAARTPGELGSAPCRRSSQARKVSAVTSSSGLVTTTAGSLGRSDAWRATSSIVTAGWDETVYSAEYRQETVVAYARIDTESALGAHRPRPDGGVRESRTLTAWVGHSGRVFRAALGTRRPALGCPIPSDSASGLASSTITRAQMKQSGLS